MCSGDVKVDNVPRKEKFAAMLSYIEPFIRHSTFFNVERSAGQRGMLIVR